MGISKNRLVGLALGFVGTLVSLDAFSLCGDEIRNTPDYRAMRACEDIRTAREAFDVPGAVRATSELQSFGYCRVQSPTGSNPVFDARLCSNPNGFVCGGDSGPRGRVMNSRCEFLHLDSLQAGRTPSWVNDRCEAESRVDTLFNAYRATSACRGLSETQCEMRFHLRRRAEIHRIERETVYTDSRLQRVSEMFERVRGEYIRLINRSTRIPAGRKAALIRRIEATTLLTSPERKNQMLNDTENSSCLSPTHGLPQTGAYNRVEETGSQLTNQIVICAGFMTNLDSMNPYLLMHILGHELSHSIDPCTLELEAPAMGRAPEPQIAQTTFPGLLPCLRGGSGPGGCGKDSALHCTVPAGIREACGESSSCRRDARATPNCRHGGEGHTHRVGSVPGSGDYRDGGAPLEQIGEAFGDFMGSEIVGRLMAADSATPPHQPNAERKRDALVNIASTFSRLHGVCMDHNTPDEHPPGYLRVNRLIMGSAAFRDAVGCGPVGAPQTLGAGATCQGF